MMRPAPATGSWPTPSSRSIRGNPQVAARMVSPLGQWRRFDAARQALMQAELRRIAERPDLSRNTGEMVGRSLGESFQRAS